MAELERAAKEGRNIMEPSIAGAKAGVTTGEWGATAAQDFRRVPRSDRRCPGRSRSATARGSTTSGKSVERFRTRLGRRIKFLVGKPGLDGHSNGAEQIAVRARDCGMEVVYEGIRLTPAQIVRAAVDESVHVVGLSILSGSHVPLVKEVMERMRKEGLDDVPRGRRRHHSARGRQDAQGLRRRRRLHPEGLPAQRHHGRHRSAGGRASQGCVRPDSACNVILKRSIVRRSFEDAALAAWHARSFAVSYVQVGRVDGREMSPTGKAVVLGLFVLLLLIGLAAGLTRDFYSRERGAYDATVTRVTPAGNDYKSPTPRLNKIEARLDDGREVAITSGLPNGLGAGARIRVIERITPWGQLWYTVAK